MDTYLDRMYYDMRADLKWLFVSEANEIETEIAKQIRTISKTLSKKTSHLIQGEQQNGI
jgi:hypothetical protein